MNEPRIFPMLDGPSIPWVLAQLIHEAATASNPVLGIQSVQNSGGYRWADIPKIFMELKRNDREKWRRIMDRSREFALACGHLDLAPIANVPVSGVTPPEMPEGGLGPLVIVCWKWRSVNYRVKYGPEHVNTLYNMVKRNYSGDFRFVCICDNADGIDKKRIEIMPLWSDHSTVGNPNGVHLPSCYRRLKIFTEELGQKLNARRVVSLDLDVIITGDLTPLWDRPDTFIGWRVPSASKNRYSFNGSMWLTVPGTYPGVWTDFDPARSPKMAQAAQYLGSDQGWMSYFFRNMDMPGWTALDGVYSFPREVRPYGKLPTNARIVIFHGGVKPWQHNALQTHSWVRAHYR